MEFCCALWQSCHFVIISSVSCQESCKRTHRIVLRGRVFHRSRRYTQPCWWSTFCASCQLREHLAFIRGEAASLVSVVVFPQVVVHLTLGGIHFGFTRLWWRGIIRGICIAIRFCVLACECDLDWSLVRCEKDLHGGRL